MSCSCDMFSTLFPLATINILSQELFTVDVSSAKCCHMRLFEEMIQPFMHLIIQNVTDSESPENKFVQKLKANRDKINELVKPLPTMSNNCVQYSVFSSHDSSCSIAKLPDNRLHCLSGYCDAKADNLCPHLEIMKT